jgi:hypothetical protein
MSRPHLQQCSFFHVVEEVLAHNNVNITLSHDDLSGVIQLVREVFRESSDYSE